MTWHLTDRVTGVFLLLFAIWYGYRTTLFKVSFMVDPVGPKAFPLILAILMGVLSLYLIIKPDPSPVWPGSATWIRIGLITLTFIAYAYLMVPIGFVLATTFEVTALALIFRGPLLKSLVGAFILSAALYGLFDMLLGLSLPTGLIFRGWWG